MTKTKKFCLVMMVLPVMACGSSKKTTIDAAAAIDAKAKTTPEAKASSPEAKASSPEATVVIDAAGPDKTATDKAGIDAAPPPAPPALGAKQIDRVGRPGVNVALNDPFNLPNAANNMAATTGAAEDEYNSNSDPTTWVAKYKARIAGNLAVLAGLAAAVSPTAACSSQVFAGPAAVAGRYDTLAGVLADDRLWVNTANNGQAAGSDNCTYLAVEVTATNLVMGNPFSADCGGRQPHQDVIAETFTILSVGLSGFMNGVFTINSGITVGSGDAMESTTAFPFLAPPL